MRLRSVGKGKYQIRSDESYRWMPRETSRWQKLRVSGCCFKVLR